MSCERRVYTFQEIEEVRIECCNKIEIEDLEKKLKISLEQKTEKLNILVKNCNLYNYGGVILVNDRYNICSDLISVAEALGMKIDLIQCPLRGKNYLITDELVNYLQQFGSFFDLGANISNQSLDATIQEIILKNTPKSDIDRSILDMVSNIKANGQYVTTRTRQITEEYDDGLIIGRSEGAWVSDAETVRKRLMEISKKAQETVNKTNAQLRDGTTKLIYSRARQMGYDVQEVKNGTQTQLVLVRCE